MPSDYARRGRPRGSGLDDRMQLRRIVELLDGDANLRPTTAIKALGISDPSTIRRLRDKLKSDPESLLVSAQSRSSDPAGGVSSPGPRAAELVEAGPAAILPVTSRPVLPRSRQSALGEPVLAQSAAVPEAQASWFAAWCAIGLNAISATVDAQMAVMEDLLQMPQVASALRQQILFNDVVKAFCPVRSDGSIILH